MLMGMQQKNKKMTLIRWPSSTGTYSQRMIHLATKPPQKAKGLLLMRSGMLLVVKTWTLRAKHMEQVPPVHNIHPQPQILPRFKKSLGTTLK